jgi:hypothetical protein
MNELSSRQKSSKELAIFLLPMAASDEKSFHEEQPFQFEIEPAELFHGLHNFKSKNMTCKRCIIASCTLRFSSRLLGLHRSEQEVDDRISSNRLLPLMSQHRNAEESSRLGRARKHGSYYCAGPSCPALRIPAQQAEKYAKIHTQKL